MKFAPSPFHASWAARNWGWPDLTDDDLRCLWVLEQHLAEQDQRFYHLPLNPAPERIGDGKFGFRFAVPSFGSFDGAGMGWLTVAAHLARVRVEVTAAYLYRTDPDDFEAEVRWEGSDDTEMSPTAMTLALRLDPYQPEYTLFGRRHPGIDRIANLIEGAP